MQQGGYGLYDPMLVGPPPSNRHTGLLIGLIGGGVVVLLIVVAVGVLYVIRPPSHDIAAPQSAGGLSRDKAAEQTLTKLPSYKQQLRSDAKGHIKSLVSGVYKGQGDEVLFLGGTSSGLDPESIVNGLTSKARSNGRAARQVSPGNLGGKAGCGEVNGAQRAAVCVWADNDTFGELIPLAGDKSIDTMAGLLTRMRPDLEKEN